MLIPKSLPYPPCSQWDKNVECEKTGRPGLEKERSLNNPEGFQGKSLMSMDPVPEAETNILFKETFIKSIKY